MILKILDWADAEAFAVSDAARGFARRSLVDMLVESGALPRTAAKRLARGILAKQVDEIALDDRAILEGFRNRLEYLGARVVLIER